MVKKRGEATRIIIKRLKREPAFPKQLADELGIPLSTVKYNLSKILPGLDLIKQLDDGKYAIEGYSSEEEKVESAHNLIRRRLLRSPKPEEIAYSIKKSPGVAKNLLFKNILGYSEPTLAEIEHSANRVWDLMFCGVEPDFPKAKDFEEGLITVEGTNIDSDNFERLFHNWEPRIPLDVARSYLKECPEMKPEIMWRMEGDSLFIKPEWTDEAIIHVRKFPKYNQEFCILFEF